MSAATDRDVLYRIGVEAHPATKGVLKGLSRESNAAQASMVKAVRSVADECLAEVRRMREGITKGRIPTATVPYGATTATGTTTRDVRGQIAAGLQPRRSQPQPPRPIIPAPARPELAPPSMPTMRGTEEPPRPASAALPDTGRHWESRTGRAEDHYASVSRMRSRDLDDDKRTLVSGSEVARKEWEERTDVVSAHYRAAERMRRQAAKNAGRDTTPIGSQPVPGGAPGPQSPKPKPVMDAEKARLTALTRIHQQRAKMENESAARAYKIREAAQKKAQKLLETQAKKAAQLREKDLKLIEAQAERERQILERRAHAAKAAAETAKAKAAGLREQSKQMGAGLAEQVGSTGGSFMRMSRGAVMLGLASKKSTEEMLRGLVKVQAGFDFVIGGANTLAKGYKSIDAIAKFMATRRAADAAAATAAARGADAEAAALAREAMAANAATAAHGRLNTARGGRIPGRTIPPPLPGKVRARVTPPPSVAARGAGTAAAGAGLGAKGAVGATIGGSGLAVAGAGIAALAGSVAGLTVAISSIRQVTKHGKSGLTSAERGSITDRIANQEVNLLRRLVKLEKGTGALGDTIDMLLKPMQLWEKIAGDSGLARRSTTSILKKLNASYDLHDKLVKARTEREAARQQDEERQAIKTKLLLASESAREQRFQRGQSLQAMLGRQSPQAALERNRQAAAYTQSRMSAATRRVGEIMSEIDI